MPPRFVSYSVTVTISPTEESRQKRQGTNRAVVDKITGDAFIDKSTMKALLSCNQNEEALAIFLAAQESARKTHKRRMKYPLKVAVWLLTA